MQPSHALILPSLLLAFAAGAVQPSIARDINARQQQNPSVSSEFGEAFYRGSGRNSSGSDHHDLANRGSGRFELSYRGSGRVNPPVQLS